jgi:drug/metabolite transporter, DME family
MQQSPEQLDGPSPRDRLVGRLCVVAAALLWSSCGLFARAPIFDDWPEWQRGLMFSFWRAFFAALVLLPTVRRPRFRGLLVPLGLCFTLMNVSYLSAIVLTTPANAIWLQAAAPWWVFLFSVVLFREPIVRRDLIPLAFGMTGVATILACEMTHNPGQNLGGIVCGVVSGITYGAVVLMLGRLRDENASWLIALNHLIAAAVMFPAVVYLGLWPSPWQLLVLAAFGALQMALPYVLLIHGLKSIRAQEAVSISLIEPVLMPLWTFLVWGVVADWWTIVGGSLIFAGLIYRYLLMDWGRAQGEG